MKTRSRSTSVPVGTLRLVGGIAVAVILAACTGSVASPQGSSSVAPSASAIASPSSEATPTASTAPSATPRPSATAAISKPGWNAAGTMLVGESFFTATALADGRALVVYGSWDPTAPVRPRAEVWAPSTNAWTQTTGFDKQRTEFALVALKDGRALVAGGLNAGDASGRQSYSSACVFDLRTGHDGCEKVGLMTVARSQPSAVLLPDGRVLVAGGYFYSRVTTGSVDDPAGVALAAWRPGESGTDTSGAILGDVVEDPHGYALATAEIFDPATGTWTSTGAMRYARVGAPIIVLSDGRVMVAGSTEQAVVGVHADAYLTAEIYDPATGRFTLAGRLPTIDHAAIKAQGVALPSDEGAPGTMGTLVALPDGGAALVGNDRWWKHEADVVRDFRYDPASNGWRQVGAACAATNDWQAGVWTATSATCRNSDLEVGLPDGRVMALGSWPMGDSAEDADHAAARLLDPVTGKSAPLPPMPGARFAETAVVLPDGSVLVMGGIGADGEYARAAVRYVRG